jgi:hypothetical protein
VCISPFVARQWLGKHVPVAKKNAKSTIFVEEFLDKAFIGGPIRTKEKLAFSSS